MANSVRIGVGVVDKASSELDRIKDKFTKLQAAGSKGILQGVGIAAGVTAFNLLGSAVSGATGFLLDGIKAAREDEISVSRLTASLNANVKGWQTHQGAIDGAIKANQRMAFSDDQTRDSLALLVGATHDVTKALAIQRTAMDLARFKGISLVDASTALVKVEGGQYRALKALGIVLKQGATSTEALAAVQKVAAGQAEAYSKTQQAAADRLADSWDELGESVGRVAAGPLADAADTASASIRTLNTSFDLLNGTVPKTGDEMRGLADDVRHSILPMANLIADTMDSAGDSMDTVAARQKVATDRFRANLTRMEGALADAKPGIERAAIATYKPIWKQFDVAAFKAQQSAEGLAGDLARGIVDGVDEIDSAMDTLTEHIKDGIDPHAKLQGQLIGKELRDGLNSSNKYIVAEARDIRLKILQQLAAHYFFTGGVNAGRSFSRGIARSTSGNTNPNVRAMGGPVTKGEAYLVGEHRPEVFVPNQNGTILPSIGSLPSAPGGNGTAGSLTVNVYANGIMTPAMARGFGDTAGPAIYDYLYRRGALGRVA